MSSKCKSENKRVLRGTKNSVRQLQSLNHQNKNVKCASKSIANRDVNQEVRSKTNVFTQVNLPMTSKVFEDLIPVNVNDSVLQDIYPKIRKHGSSIPMEKDPEPILGDYLNPIKPLELKIETCDYSPTAVKETETFTYHRVNDLFKALNVDS